jgi:alpha-methylacyl-CoA racemase
MGPLAGVKIIEIAGLGPGPFCGMLLSDMGADVLRLDRVEAVATGNFLPSHADLLARGRRSVAIDLKHPEGVNTVLRLVERADALYEGFRPGVMERLGLGPDRCLARNPRLVYGRMTGWGQEGSLAQAAGHDINYIALAGALWPIGRAGGAPVPPLNLIGDFGGGGVFLAFGIVCALLEARQSGRGQVVDAAMVDGASILMTFIYALREAGVWTDRRGVNLLDSGAPFYNTYETGDGEYVAVGAIEPQFYVELVTRLGLDQRDLPAQFDRATWPAMRERFAAIFRTKSREEWCALLEGTDACFAPVLGLDEAYTHPHHRIRGAFAEVAGVRQPAPAPRFSRTRAAIQGPPRQPGADTGQALADWGFAAADIARLYERGAIAGTQTAGMDRAPGTSAGEETENG